MRDFHSQIITDEAQVGAARRAVHRYARELLFTDDELAEIDIVVQEIGTNAVRYATGGGLLHWTQTPGGVAAGLELFYCDKGPGIHDLERAARDGVSSGGSLGAGLGAVRRLMDEFDAYSTVRGQTRRLPNSRRTTHGTALLGRKWAAATHTHARERERELLKRIGVWSRPRIGEDANGDAYFIGEGEGETLYAVIDGLGHGPGAREAAAAALATLEGWDGEPLDELLWAVHDALRSTRGAVIGAVTLDRERGVFHYAGVGNIEVRVLNAAEPSRPIPANGTLGARLSQVRVWPHRWAEGTSIVMASDGLSASWDIESYPELLSCGPQLLAGILLRDYGRDSDDATVLVIR